MGLLPRPLTVRIEGGEEAAGLAERAAREGLVLAAPGEEVDLVARASRGSPRINGPGGQGRARLRALEASPPLGRRELEILEYLADGWSNAEIASALGIGTRTVRFHLANLYASLGVGRRGEAVREAVRLGLIRFET